MKKNILIIDDSALMRRVISDIINQDDRFVVAGMAVNGLEALDLITKDPFRFDALLLDINMPKMNGLELLRKMKHNRIKIPVIVVSTVAKEGAKETIEALELGAFDFVTKPDSFIDAKSDSFKDKILICLLAATKLDVGLQKQSNEPVVEMKKTVPFKKREISIKAGIKSGMKLVALACSTGGPRALQSVIPNLPDNLAGSVLVVQHMPEGFTNSLALRLDEISKMSVKEAEDGEIIQDGFVYIAKGGYQMRVQEERNGTYRLVVTLEAPRNGLKPCADIMYESLVSSRFTEITCVVLTGMGADGTQGIKKLNEQNNIYVIAQDEPTSTVYGMPKMIYGSGLVNEVLPLEKITEAIIKNVGVR